MNNCVYDNIVLGSGAGGAIASALLSEHGKKVLLIEEGNRFELGEVTSFSKEEMLLKYRNSGVTFCWGKPKISYVEGKVYGGGSEINAGLYHRPPKDILDRWKVDFQLRDTSLCDLEPFCVKVESDLNISYAEKHPSSSLILKRGAEKLGWNYVDVPRWFYKNKRQSMSQTYLPRAVRAGCDVITLCKVKKIKKINNQKWLVETNRGAFECIDLFVCCGAIQTASILQRSGIRKNIGDNFQLHPTVKTVALFNENVNDYSNEIPTHQIKEFSPSISFGCSISSPAHLAAGLADYDLSADFIADNWKRMATFYCMGHGVGTGKIRSFPFIDNPIVSYKISEKGLKKLAFGLRKLSELLLNEGAIELFPSITKSSSIKNKEDIYQSIPSKLSKDLTKLMSIHLFSSCPMGEDKKKCPVNSFGKSHFIKGLYIADASLLCTSLGVNPQGSVMAIVYRNIMQYLRKN